MVFVCARCIELEIMSVLSVVYRLSRVCVRIMSSSKTKYIHFESNINSFDS